MVVNQELLSLCGIDVGRSDIAGFVDQHQNFSNFGIRVNEAGQGFICWYLERCEY
jgi:hypothetical protein